MTLKIDDENDCGGNNVRLVFKNQNKKCFTARKGGFSAGVLLHWEGTELSNCESMIFDNSTTVKVESTSSEQFCPRRLTVISEQSSKSIWFYTNINTGFHQAAIDNNIEHQLSGKTKQLKNNLSLYWAGGAL